MNEQELAELREKYDLDNDDLYMILTGQDTLEDILQRRGQ